LPPIFQARTSLPFVHPKNSDERSTEIEEPLTVPEGGGAPFKPLVNRLNVLFPFVIGSTMSVIDWYDPIVMVPS
jgi:hypothetical protein